MKEFVTNIEVDGNSLSFTEFYYLVTKRLSDLFVYNDEWNFDEVTSKISFTVYFLADDLWEAAEFLKEKSLELSEEQISITWEKPTNIFK
jgi:hypothetical protein